jgi:hypothetical protein
MATRLPFYPDPPRNPEEEIARANEIRALEVLSIVEVQRIIHRRSAKEPKLFYVVDEHGRLR